MPMLVVVVVLNGKEVVVEGNGHGKNDVNVKSKNN